MDSFKPDGIFDLSNHYRASFIECRTILPKESDEVERTLTIKIRGRITEGLGVGTDFTSIPWVKAQFISKLSIDPYPGTLNLEIADREDCQKFEALKAQQGIEITPEDPSFCKGKSYPVLIMGRLRAAIVVPVVENYPKHKMELIASQNVKEALSLKTGDSLEVEILQ